MYINPGQILCLTQGEYADYQIIGHFQVLKTIDDSTVEDFKAQRTKETRYDLRDDFVAYLAVNNYIEDHHVKQVWLGDYGRLTLGNY